MLTLVMLLKPLSLNHCCTFQARIKTFLCYDHTVLSLAFIRSFSSFVPAGHVSSFIVITFVRH